MTAMEANTMNVHDITEWRDLAACRSVDPEWFFPTAEPGSPLYGAEVARAKTICGRCPVRAACLRAAAGEPWGISGGLTEYERRVLNHGGSAAADPAARAAAHVARFLAEGPPSGASAADLRRAGLALLAGGASPLQVAERLGVSARSVQRWTATRTAAVRAKEAA